MKVKLLLASAGLALMSTAALAAPLSYELPEETAEFKPGPNVEAAQNNCAACHSADYINYQPPGMGHDFWAGEVNKMINTYHAPIDPDDAKMIIEYLSATYGGK